MQITKASGESEEFNEEKLLNSISRAGVQENIGKNALRLVKDNLSSNTDTNKVRDLVSRYLKQHSQPVHYTNYNLKNALFQLGPTGYPFESFIGRILREFDYRTKVSVVLRGKCVSHEIDVIAKKQNRVFYVECKFHNSPGIKTDVRVALYTKARFDDLTNATNNRSHHNFASWLITNTKVTQDAIDYANCQNIKITSWSYPVGESLYDLIVASKLHPITVLTSLSSDQIKMLLKQNIVTIKDLNNLDLLPKDTLDKVKKEIRAITHNAKS